MCVLLLASCFPCIRRWPAGRFIRMVRNAQKQTYLLPMAQGKKLGAYCLTESESGSDAGAMRTTATKDGDAYVLNGSKLFVTNGGEAEVYIVFALTDAQNKQRGCTAFIVEKGTEGLIFGTKEKSSASAPPPRWS